MQISGHKNIHSINNYSHINEDQHRQISEILHTDAPSSNALYGQDMQPRVQSQQSYLHSSKNHENCFQLFSTRLWTFSKHFDAQIHGGTFNIHINQNSETIKNMPLARKRLRILVSDSNSISLNAFKVEP